MGRFLDEQATIDLIDVTAAEKSDAGNGHNYFRQSPWASSDLLMSLMYGPGPRERGLDRTEENPIWSFPPDYVDRLIQAIRTTKPNFWNSLNRHAIKSTPAPVWWQIYYY